METYGIPFEYFFLIITSFHWKTTWNTIFTTWFPVKDCMFAFFCEWFQVETYGNSTWNFPAKKILWVMEFHLKTIWNPLNSTRTTTCCVSRHFRWSTATWSTGDRIECKYKLKYLPHLVFMYNNHMNNPSFWRAFVKVYFAHCCQHKCSSSSAWDRNFSHPRGCFSIMMAKHLVMLCSSTHYIVELKSRRP